MLLLLLFVFLSVATSTEGGDGDGHTAFVTPVADRGDARPDSPGAARPVGVSAPGDTGTVPTPGAANTGAAHPGGPGPGAGATGPDLRLPPLELFSEYERSYTTVTPFGADSCFYVEEVRRGNTLDLEYLVLATAPPARPDSFPRSLQTTARRGSRSVTDTVIRLPLFGSVSSTRYSRSRVLPRRTSST